MYADKPWAEESFRDPVGPVTRARAKRFKDQLNNLIQKIQQEDSGLQDKVEWPRLIHVIKANTSQGDHTRSIGLQWHQQAKHAYSR